MMPTAHAWSAASLADDAVRCVLLSVKLSTGSTASVSHPFGILRNDSYFSLSSRNPR